MKRPPRRVLWYMLLLILPSVLVGGAGIWLIQREQERIRQDAANARRSREEAVAARLAVVADNLALLVNETQSELLNSLGITPFNATEEELGNWSESNPLLQLVYRISSDGVVRFPGDAAADDVRAWLDDGGLGNVWKLKKSRPEVSPVAKKSAGVPALDLAENTRNSDADLYSSTPIQIQAQANASSLMQVRHQLKSESQIAVRPRETFADQPNSAGVIDPDFANNEISLRTKESSVAVGSVGQARQFGGLGSQAYFQTQTINGTDKRRVDLSLLKDLTPEEDKSDWAFWTHSGVPHWFAWRHLQHGGDGWLGFELNLAEMTHRLSQALPKDFSGSERYELSLVGTLHHYSVGTTGPGTLVTRTYIGAANTWQLSGWLIDSVDDGTSANGFWLLGSVVLVGAVLAIWSGGWILMGQARRGEMEAAQKTSFVAHVSHEFKTPLTTIRLYAELLEQGRVRDEQRRGEYLQTIGRESQRLSRLVNNILDFSRLERGKHELHMQAQDLAALLLQLRETMAPRIREAGLCDEWAGLDQPHSAVVDADGVSQIVINLLDNACKYAASGKKLEIALIRRESGGFRISVSDRGPGIPERRRQEIFEMFMRLDESLTSDQRGAGLGLSIARQLARRMGGELWCETREGGGSVFIFQIS